jgi:hypothetical protein
MSQPQGAVARATTDQSVTPDVRAPSRSWSLAFLAYATILKQTSSPPAAAAIYEPATGRFAQLHVGIMHRHRERRRIS